MHSTLGGSVKENTVSTYCMHISRHIYFFLSIYYNFYSIFTDISEQSYVFVKRKQPNMANYLTEDEKNNNYAYVELRHTISVLVHNHPGVLSRISGLFARRGFNIESITCSVTEDGTLSRLTLVVSGDEYELEQIVKQVAKLEDSIKVQSLEPRVTVRRELALVKLEAREADRGPIMETADIFRAKIVDVSRETMIVEITGDQDKIDAFLELMRPGSIKELVRTGVTALSRGPSTIREVEEE
jgi:acetolactate synthase I/III small subunit